MTSSGVPLVLEVARHTVGVACIIVEFSMAPNNKIDLGSLEDWCKWMHDFCKSKSLCNVAPIMSESAQREEEEDDEGKMWGDESARGAWLRYEKMDGVGSNVSLNQLVGFAFALCCYIWHDYKKLSKKV